MAILILIGVCTDVLNIVFLLIFVLPAMKSGFGTVPWQVFKKRPHHLLPTMSISEGVGFGGRGIQNSEKETRNPLLEGGSSLR